MTERTTILIVDDESKIRRLLSRSLETEGFDVAVADSAMSASEFLKNGHCDLIILDYIDARDRRNGFLSRIKKEIVNPRDHAFGPGGDCQENPGVGTRSRRLCGQAFLDRRDDGEDSSHPETLRRD